MPMRRPTCRTKPRHRSRDRASSRFYPIRLSQMSVTVTASMGRAIRTIRVFMPASIIRITVSTPGQAGSRQTISETVTELLSLRAKRSRTQVLIAAEASTQSGERRRARGLAAITVGQFGIRLSVNWPVKACSGRSRRCFLWASPNFRFNSVVLASGEVDVATGVAVILVMDDPQTTMKGKDRLR